MWKITKKRFWSAISIASPYFHNILEFNNHSFTSFSEISLKDEIMNSGPKKDEIIEGWFLVTSRGKHVQNMVVSSIQNIAARFYGKEDNVKTRSCKEQSLKFVSHSERKLTSIHCVNGKTSNSINAIQHPITAVN